MSSRLNLRARKSLVCDLLNSTHLGSSESDIQTWVAPSCENDTFSVVWLQGVIKEVNCDSFVLEDISGCITVSRISAVHPGCPQPREGAYFLVIGDLCEANPKPEVKAMKFHDLTSEKDYYKHLWPLEVKDSQLFMAQSGS